MRQSSGTEVFLLGEGEWERGRGWGNKYLGTGEEEEKREAERSREKGRDRGRERTAEKRRVGKRRGRVLVATAEDTPCQF